MYYRRVAIETFKNLGEASPRKLRARPLPGQGLTMATRVECSEAMRMDYPVGTVFIVKARISNREGSSDFLYTHYNWPYEVVERRVAEALIIKGQL